MRTYKTRKYPKRQTRCYAIAIDFIYDNEGCTLVHGLGLGADGMSGHAWVELPDGGTYEPVIDTFFLEADDQPMRVPQARYSRWEMSGKIVDERHNGPWHE